MSRKIAYYYDDAVGNYYYGQARSPLRAAAAARQTCHRLEQPGLARRLAAAADGARAWRRRGTR
jgi:hypothetical protein